MLFNAVRTNTGPAKTFRFNGSSYEFISAEADWPTAVGDCNSRGRKLLDLHNNFEEMVVERFLQGYLRCHCNANVHIIVNCWRIFQSAAWTWSRGSRRTISRTRVPSSGARTAATRSCTPTGIGHSLKTPTWHILKRLMTVCRRWFLTTGRSGRTAGARIITATFASRINRNFSRKTDKISDILKKLVASYSVWNQLPVLILYTYSTSPSLYP